MRTRWPVCAGGCCGAPMANRKPFQRWVSRTIGRPLETAGLHIVHFLFSSLPLDVASALGGAVARAVGPRLGLSRRARRNLERAFPDMKPAEIEWVVRDMWDNLGRVAAGMPHLSRIKVFDSDPATGPRRVEAVIDVRFDAVLS